MPSNKERLYVGLYARGGTAKMPGGEDKYHWALLVGPKVENNETRGKRFHAKERIYSGMQSVWEFSEQETGTASTLMILLGGEQEGWNCFEWVREALATLKNDSKALGTSVLDWATLRDTAMSYVQEKGMKHRFDGQAAPGQFDTSIV
ncbi:hypothetical protein FPOAC2_14617 [Fusarium poae]